METKKLRKTFAVQTPSEGYIRVKKAAESVFCTIDQLPVTVHQLQWHSSSPATRGSRLSVRSHRVMAKPGELEQGSMGLLLEVLMGGSW